MNSSSGKIKVLHVIAPILQWGGGDTILLNLVSTKLKNEMDEVALVYDSPKLKSELEKIGVKYHVLQHKTIPVEKAGKKYEIGRMFFNFFHAGHLRQLIQSENYDVVHVHGFSAAWMIFTCHVNMHGMCVYTHHAYREKSSKIERLVLTPMYRWFGQCTAVSETAAESMRKAFPGVTKGFIGVCNSINEAFFKEKQETQHISREEGKYYFIQAARLMEGKNHELVIQSVAKLPCEYKEKIRIVFCGGGPKMGQLRSMAQKLDVEKNILFAGEVKFDEVPEYMDECDFGLFPCKIEGFGLGAAECLARELPVLALDNELMREVVGAAGMLVDEDHLTEGMIGLITSGKSLRECAKRQAQKYRPMVMKENYYRVYMDLLGK